MQRKLSQRLDDAYCKLRTRGKHRWEGVPFRHSEGPGRERKEERCEFCDAWLVQRYEFEPPHRRNEPWSWIKKRGKKEPPKGT